MCIRDSWGFTVAAESDGHVLVDASDFFLRDGQGAATALRPGTYRVDRTRSAFYMERTKGFPKNSEIEVTLTFANEPTGGRGGGFGPSQGPPAIGAAGGGAAGGRGGLFSGTVASVTPTAEAVTLREHYSLVELPDGNYTPRLDDPRAGYGCLLYTSCSMPFRDVAMEALQEKWTRDPFDRLIVANAKAAGAPLVTKDEHIRKHYRRAIW